MDNTYREPTPNERLYLEKQIRARRGSHRFGFYALALLSLGLVALAVVAFLANVLAGLMSLAVLAVTLLATRVLYTASGLSDLDRVAHVFPLEGRFHREVVGSGRAQQVRYYIGDISVAMPGHWRKKVKQDDQVRAEAHIHTIGYNEQTGIARAVHPQATLVSLNDTYFVDREVSRGLMELRFPVSLVIGGSLVLLGLILGSITMLSAKITPAAAYDKYLYDRESAREFRTVGDLLAAAPELTGRKVVLARAALAPAAEEGLFYLFDPMPEDGTALSELLGVVPDEESGRRAELLAEFKEANPVALTRENAWGPYESFADNPAYAEMKKRFLTEGKSFLETGRTEFMVNAGRLKKEGAYPYSYLVEFVVLAGEYRAEFLRTEESRLDEIRAERWAALTAKLPGCIEQVLQGRAKISLREAYDGEYDWVVNTVTETAAMADGEDPFAAREMIRGRLVAAGDGKTVGMDQRLEEMDESQVMLYMVLCAILGGSLPLILRGFFVWRRNRAIVGEIERLYA